MHWQEWLALSGIIFIGIVILIITIKDMIIHFHYLKSKDKTDDTGTNKGDNSPKPARMSGSKVIELNNSPDEKCSTYDNTTKPPCLFRKFHNRIIEMVTTKCK